MKKLTRETLTGLTEQMASHAWRGREIDELVDPKLGIITGFQVLLEQLEELRRTDLGDTAPAQGVQRGNSTE
jgi:hypothetical protein